MIRAMFSICSRVGTFLLLKSVQSATLKGTDSESAETAEDRLFAFAEPFLDVRPVARAAQGLFVS